MGKGCKLSASCKRLHLSKIGEVKLIYHRHIEGTPKTATIRHTPTGKWFVTIACEWKPTPLPSTGKIVGIDVGLKSFATLSDGQEIANPHFFRQEEHALAKAQRKHRVALDTLKAKQVEVVERVKQEHPDLDEVGIQQKVNQDARERAAWNQFTDLIACKAAWADRRYVAVNPTHTSQDCVRHEVAPKGVVASNPGTCPMPVPNFRRVIS